MEKNNNTLPIVFIAGILLIAVILVLNQGQTKIINTAAQQQNAVSVSGDASVEVEPDKAEIYVKIETFSESAQDAKDENSRLSDSVRKAMKKQGIKDNDMETTTFYLSPKYKYNRNTGESTLQGYTLTNVIRVTTKDVDDAGKLIDTAVDAGANGVDRVSFGLTKETEKEVSGQALVKAAQLAEDKATSLAKSLKINLGKIISVQESNFNLVRFDYAPMAEAAVAEAKVSTEISPQKVEVTARVALAYEIK
jgi:hypothetical protein|tara:strand:+ start:1262 stop:2014 length:753 start_codon:yes stop_codon:yes gene_type:complete